MGGAARGGWGGGGGGGCGEEEADPAGLDRLALGEGGPLGLQVRCPAQPADDRPEFALDDGLAEILVAEALRRVAAGMWRRGEARQDVLVEEMGEGAVADVLEE